MKLLGVIDVLHGRAVHARAGARDRYAPVTAVGSVSIDPGDTLAVAKAYIDRLGLMELYVADLDAILRHPRDADRASQGSTAAFLAAMGVPIWLDAGVTSIVEATRALTVGATTVIVGLETLPSFATLEEICTAAGGDRVAFSLDLREGEPILDPGGSMSREPVIRMAERAAAAGARTVIVLDLARVGTARLMDVGLIAGVRAAVPDVALLVGGGVRGLDDIERLADLGCDGALVATALHNGRLGRTEVAAAHQIGREGRHGRERR